MAWDPRYPPAAQLPTGLAGMVAHENRLLSEPGELLAASGVALDDLYARKEPGAAAYDTTGLAPGPTFTGTLSGSSTWAALFSLFTGSSIAAVGNTATASKAAGSASLTVTVPSGGWPLGAMIVIGVTNYQGALTNAFVVSTTDSRGNVWGFLPDDDDQTFHAFNDSNLQGVYSFLTTALSAGDVIVLTFTDPNSTSRAAAFALSGVAAPIQSRASSSGVGTATSVGPMPGRSTEHVNIAIVGNDSGRTQVPGGTYVEAVETAGANAAVAVSYVVEVVSPTIVALTDWYSDVETVPGGSVTTVVGSKAVVGVGTTFTDHAPGDRIVVANETRVISSIADAENLVTVVAFATANAAVAYKVRVGNRIVSASTSGNLFKEKPLTLTTGNLDAVTLKSGLSKSARPGRFIAGGKEAAALPRKLFYFNGVDPVQVLSGDGTTTAAITTPPADWGAAADENKQPINALVHENRLVAWGNLNDPHRVYASDPDDHENFTSASAISIRFRSEIGDRIWCGASFQGVFFVWKYPRGVFYLDDTDLDIQNWTVRAKSEAIGCAPSPYAALPIDDDVLFMAADASFHLLTAVDALGGVRASDVTRRLGLSKWIRDNVNLERLNQVVSVWYPQKKLALFTVPGTGSEDNNLTLKFDFSGVERDLPVKFSYSIRDVGDALAIRRAPAGGPETPILGQAGFVYLLDQDDRNKNGVAYTGQYQTPHLDFSHLDPSLRWKRKSYEHLSLVMEPVDAGTVTVEVFVDGTLRQTLLFDATRKRQKQKLNVGDGFTISLRVTNAALDEDFKILSHLIFFKPGNEDESR